MKGGRNHRRVKANLAQYERLVSAQTISSTNEIEVGEIKINADTRRVYVNHQEIELKNKEYELLHFLVTNADIVFSKEALYERIWGMDAFGDIKTVAVHINRLREKMEKNVSNPVHIQTV